MTIRKKIIWVAAFLVFMAVAIVLCVELFSSAQESSYDGTLVRVGTELITLIRIPFSYLS